MKLDVVDEEEMLPMPMQHLDNRRLALNTSNDYSSKWIIQGERVHSGGGGSDKAHTLKKMITRARSRQVEEKKEIDDSVAREREKEVSLGLRKSE